MAILIKKLFWPFFILMLIFVVIIPTKSLGQSISIKTEPAQAKVGDQVTITIYLEEIPAESKKVHLYISEFVPSNPTEGQPSLKAVYDATPAGHYQYVWDTKLSQSNPGQYNIVVFITDALGNVKYSQVKEGFVLSADNIPVNPLQTTTPPTSSGGTGSSSSAALGAIGKIIFPSTKVSSIEDLIIAIIEWLLALAGGLAVIAIVYSGVMYLTAGGDPAKAEAAKKNLVWAIIGVVVITLAIVIVNTVADVLTG